MRKSKLAAISLGLVLVVIGTWLFFGFSRQEDTIFDREMNLGSEQAVVTIKCSRNRVIFAVPHGPRIGGGDVRYQTSIATRTDARLC